MSRMEFDQCLDRLDRSFSFRRGKFEERMTGNDVTNVWIDQVEVIAVAIHRIKHHLKVARVKTL